jgi:hypothetical protein
LSIDFRNNKHIILYTKAKNKQYVLILMVINYVRRN